MLQLTRLSQNEQSTARIAKPVLRPRSVQLSLTADNSGGSVAFTRENTLTISSIKPNSSSNPRGLGELVEVQRKQNLKMLIGLLWGIESLKTPFTASHGRVHLREVSSG